MHFYTDFIRILNTNLKDTKRNGTSKIICNVITVDKLILTAKQKLNVLIQAVSKMDVTAEVKANANAFYHGILARTMRDNYKDEVVAEGGKNPLKFCVINFTIYVEMVNKIFMYEVKTNLKKTRTCFLVGFLIIHYICYFVDAKILANAALV